MLLNTIKRKDFDRLKALKNENPNLTFENIGYQEINKEILTENDKNAIKEIESIMQKLIVGFDRFQNFRNKNQEMIRFQYNYSEDYKIGREFIGVGYLSFLEIEKLYVEDLD